MGGVIKLDSRLEMCADFVRVGSRVADIGTDHAYLPIKLCLSGKCPSAVAADIRSAPLKRGADAIKRLGAEKLVSARISDGLQNISAGEADDIVIAGMGGELTASIIDRCVFSRDSSKRFILQPMTRSETLIKYLYENGFELIRQDCCAAGGKCYTVICAAYKGGGREYGEEDCYIGLLDPKSSGLHRLFIENHIKRLRKKANGDLRFGALADLLEEKLSR